MRASAKETGDVDVNLLGSGPTWRLRVGDSASFSTRCLLCAIATLFTLPFWIRDVLDSCHPSVPPPFFHSLLSAFLYLGQVLVLRKPQYSSQAETEPAAFFFLLFLGTDRVVTMNK